jgi:hypothetical protein
MILRERGMQVAASVHAARGCGAPGCGVPTGQGWVPHGTSERDSPDTIARISAAVRLLDGGLQAPNER